MGDNETWEYIRQLESLLGKCFVFIKKAHHHDGCCRRYCSYQSPKHIHCDCKHNELLEATREYEKSIIKVGVSI